MLKLPLFKAETNSGAFAKISRWGRALQRRCRYVAQQVAQVGPCSGTVPSSVAVLPLQLSVNCYPRYPSIKQSEAITLQLLYFERPLRNITDVTSKYSHLSIRMYSHISSSTRGLLRIHTNEDEGENSAGKRAPVLRR